MARWRLGGPALAAAMARWRLGGPALAAALALFLTADEAAACARPQGWTGGARIAGELWTAWWRSEPAAIPVSKHFSIRFHLCGPPVDRVRVHGWMPDHRHGMNYRPRGDPGRVVRNGRGSPLPHAGALGADSGRSRRGGPGDADLRNDTGVTPRRSSASVAARLIARRSGFPVAICILSGIAALLPSPASALDFTPEERRRSPYTLLGRFNDDAERSTAAKTHYVRLRQSNFGEFRVPVLRNAALTAPYMHAGSLETLADVARHYSTLDEERLHAGGERILRRLDLRARERADLVAFLETLTEEKPLHQLARKNRNRRVPITELASCTG